MRADGRDFAEDQALYQQFETDRMTCQGEEHSGNIPTNAAYHSTGDIGGNAPDCMGKKGYTVVQSVMAVLKRQDLAAKAAEKAQREAWLRRRLPHPRHPQSRSLRNPSRSPRWGLHRNRRRRAQHPGGKLANVTTGTGAFDAIGTELAAAANSAWLIVLGPCAQ